MKNDKFELAFRIIVVVLLVLVSIRSCNTQRRVERELLPKVNSLTEQVEVINESLVDNEELELMLEIVGFEISYRMLFDNNTVIRTTRRPDDIMNDYVQKKRELQRKLIRLRQGVEDDKE